MTYYHKSSAAELAQTADLIGKIRRHGVTYPFYEDPVNGDEVPLLCIFEGEIVSTSDYEWDEEELTYWIDSRTQGFDLVKTNGDCVRIAL